MQFDEQCSVSGSGLGVLLQYMSKAEQGEWAALRTVADLSVATGAERAYRPLLKMALTCDGCQRRRPLLSIVTEMEKSVSPIAVSASNPAVGERQTASAARYPLVRALVEQCVSEGQTFAALNAVARATTPSTESSAAYPALQKALRSAHSDDSIPLLAALASMSGHSPRVAVDESDAAPTALSNLPRNVAFVFIKPHACTEGVRQLVESRLREAKFRIEQRGVVKAEDIDQRGLIDQHYAAIARYAIQWPAAEIPLSEDAMATFQKTFGVSWKAVVKGGKVLNAAQAAQWYSCKNGEALVAKWNELVKRTKLCPGLYVGHDAKDDLYVINGFYLRNREKFTAPGSQIEWYVVSWEEGAMPWKAFRAAFIGSTDPTAAVEGSLRANILKQWKALGLPAEPNVSDNGVHASAGPLEGLSERVIWLQLTEGGDVFGRQLQQSGVPFALQRQLCQNPEVKLTVDGVSRTGLAFDLLEDCNSSLVVESLRTLQKEKQQEYEQRVAQNLPVTTALDVLLQGKTETLVALDALHTSHQRRKSTDESANKAAVHPKPSAEPSAMRPQPPAVAAPPRLARPAASDGRLSSPYVYAPRGNGIGLATVFRHTISTGTAPVHFGLGLLHSVVLGIKQSAEVDPFGRVTVEPWPSVTSQRLDMTAKAATTVAASPKDTKSKLAVNTQLQPTLGMQAAAARRLTTADRIRRRTQKLQAEVEGIERRREERAAALLHHPTAGAAAGFQTPRKPSIVKATGGPSPRQGAPKEQGGLSPVRGGIQVRGDGLSLQGVKSKHEPESVPDIKGELLRATAVATSKSPVLATLSHRGPTSSSAK